MSNWNEVKVKYHKLDQASGKVKKVTDSFLVDAVSFTNAEAIITKEIEQYVRDEFKVMSITQTKYTDVLEFSDSENWFKCKVTYTDIDQKSGKEKKFTNLMLVSANNADEAYKRLEDNLGNWIVPFDIPSVSLTKIIEVITYKPKETEN